MRLAAQSIINKIHEDAEDHGAERYARIKAEIDDEIRAENEFYLSEQAKRREALLKHDGLEYSRLTEKLDSRLKDEISQYRNDLLDEIFGRALEKLRGIEDGELFDLLGAALGGLDGVFVLYPGEFSKDRLTDEIVSKAAEGISGLRVTLSGEAVPGKSGFLLRNETLEYDCLFEDMLDEKKNEQAAFITREVFGV